MLCMTPGRAASSQIGATSPLSALHHPFQLPNTDRAGKNMEHPAHFTAGLNSKNLVIVSLFQGWNIIPDLP